MYQVIEIQYEEPGNNSGNKIWNVVQWILSYSFCVQNCIEFGLIITELCSIL